MWSYHDFNLLLMSAEPSTSSTTPPNCRIEAARRPRQSPPASETPTPATPAGPMPPPSDGRQAHHLHRADPSQDLPLPRRCRDAEGQQPNPTVAKAVKGWRNRALTADALTRIRETLRLPRRCRGGWLESAETRSGPRRRGPGGHWSSGRRRAQTLRGHRPDLAGR